MNSSLFNTHSQQDIRINRDVPLVIPRASLFGIFQFHDEELYGQLKLANADCHESYFIKSSLDKVGSPIAGHFHTGAPTKNIDVYVGANEAGYYVSFIDYVLDGAHGENLHSAMIIGQLSDDDRDLSPYFIMTGENVLIENNQEALMVRDVICRHRPDGAVNDIMGRAKTDSEIIAGICYADQMFRDMISNFPVELESAQQWIQPDALRRASERYQSIKTRNAIGLHQELDFPPIVDSNILDAKRNSYIPNASQTPH